MPSKIEMKARIESLLSSAQPPDNPLLNPGWAALAFDRNRYEDLAPTDVWRAWLETNLEFDRSEQGIEVVSMSNLDAGLKPQCIPADIFSIREYWREDARFLSDHYILSPQLHWLIRLDQDVTLFSAKIEFLRKFCDKAGGLDRVFSMMQDDFSPGEEDRAGLGVFLRSITVALRE